MAKAKQKTKSRAARMKKPSKPTRRKAGAKPIKRPPAKLKKNENGVVMLAGGNPQIAKADGDAPVQHYIDNMPDWKRSQGRKLDALITRLVPHVRKAVKWNSPFYGIEGQGWFLVFHVFTRYIKVTFLKGRSLQPLPPVASKDPHARYVHIEESGFDEAQMTDWIKQAAAIPGWLS